MDVFVSVVWSVLLLTHTPSLKAESSASFPASSSLNVSLNESVDDVFVTSKITDPEEATGTEPSGASLAPQHISADNDKKAARGGASTISVPTLTPVSTTYHASTKIIDIKEPNVGATIGTGIVQPPESVTKTNPTQGSLDITPSLIPLTRTTITPLSPIPSSTDLSKEHRNSSQSTASETIPAGSLIPASSPASTLKDLITGSESLGKENQNQDGPSELDVGDEDSDKVPSPSPLDPLLAGLISVFILSTALLSIFLFLKFHQHSRHPEFHRLQDLPMDDLLEDTPLSRYSY